MGMVYDKIINLSATIAADGTTGSIDLSGDGVWPFPDHPVEVVAGELTLPNWTNTVTTTIELKAPGGAAIFSKATLAQNTAHPIPQDAQVRKLMLEKKGSIAFTLSGVPGEGGGTISLVLYVLRRA